jgi:hypothetical protein
MAELLAGPLGDGIRRSLRSAGLRRRDPTIADIERVCYRDDARVFFLAPADARRKVVGRHRRPKYRWRVERPAH